jgi:hypothetical protein
LLFFKCTKIRKIFIENKHLEETNMAKERKPLLDPYTQMTTKDLVKILEGYHGDSEEARKKREATRDDLLNSVESLNDIEKDYLVTVRGEHKRYKGKPKSRTLSKEKAHEEATEILYGLALEGIKQQYGAQLAEMYKGDLKKYQSSIEGYITLKGIQFDELRKAMVKNRRHFTEVEDYKKIKALIAQDTIEDIVEVESVERALQTKQSHREPYIKLLNETFQKKGYKLKATTPIGQAIQFHKKHLEGPFNQEYIGQNDEYLEKATK